MQFTKLFNSILDSTIWQEPPSTKIVWITMLAMCDRNGDVFASIPGLANRAGVSTNDCEAAITCFLSPDRYSRTKDNEGRRIAVIDGGWTLLNHGKYRALLSAEERREYNRRKQAEYRAKHRGNVNDMSMTVNDCNRMSAMSTHTEADTEALSIDINARERKDSPRCTIEQSASYAATIGLTKDQAETWWHTRNAAGWVKPAAGGGTQEIRSWQSDMAASRGWLAKPKPNDWREAKRARECPEPERDLSQFGC